LRRRKPIHENGDYQKQTYQKKDNLRLKIIVFLSTTKDGSYKAEIYNKAKLGTQNWTNLVELLNDLIEWGWIEQKHVYGKDIFKITDNGMKVAKHIKDILFNEYPLKNLDIFDGISLSHFTSDFT
jgi:predicted transcriptional regulator